MNYLIMHIVGARPNFMKIAPIMSAINEYNSTHHSPVTLHQILVHTGQHYDEKMSKLFFDHLGLPKPDINLGVGSASHAVQTAEIMKRFEKVLLEYRPDAIIVVGDVNSTIACTLVASKIEYSTCNSQLVTCNLKRQRPLIVHVEAGLRSFDRTMPEEINRILTDQLSDLLFTTEEDANENLKREGISPEKIFFVGNVMIDTLYQHLEKAQKSKILQKLGLINPINQSTHQPNQPINLINPKNPTNPINSTNSINAINPYAVLTLHRPSNVDHKETFVNIIEAIKEIAKHIPIIFPVHPRTQNRIKQFGFEQYFKRFSTLNLQLAACNSGIYCIEPLGYLDFLCLMANAKLVLTDSGGIQEETTVLGIPCVTIRENTERPITVKMGTNIIAGTRKENIISAAFSQLNKPNQPYKLNQLYKPNKLNKLNKLYKPNNATNSTNPIPPLWDGKAAERIVDILVDKLQCET